MNGCRSNNFDHLYAAVADGAVGAPWRPVELTGDAPLHAHRYPVDFDIPVEGRAKVVVSVLVGGCARDHPGVHEGRQTESANHCCFWCLKVLYFESFGNLGFS